MKKMSEVSLTEPGGIREKWDYLGQTVLKRFFKKNVRKCRQKVDFE